jgi:hypothetical protein
LGHRGLAEDGAREEDKGADGADKVLAGVHDGVGPFSNDGSIDRYAVFGLGYGPVTIVSMAVDV